MVKRTGFDTLTAGHGGLGKPAVRRRRRV